MAQKTDGWQVLERSKPAEVEQAGVTEKKQSCNPTGRLGHKARRAPHAGLGQ